MKIGRSNNQNRLYKDLAWLWPLWEDVEEYRDESEQVVRLIKEHSLIEPVTLLDMGCGGGKNMFHLKRHFQITGIDLSEPMLKNARKLNPDCEFLIADMRGFDIKRGFDAVFINDSITDMQTPEELSSVFACAFKHLKPGGGMICYPDFHKESFQQNNTRIFTSSKGGYDITFIQNDYDPDPSDYTFEMTLIYLIRKEGEFRIEHDLHISGIFTLDLWRKSLNESGFQVDEIVDSDLHTFVCIKPLD